MTDAHLQQCGAPSAWSPENQQHLARLHAAMTVFDDGLQWRRLSRLSDEFRDIKLTEYILVERGICSNTLHGEVLPSNAQMSPFDVIFFVLFLKPSDV